MSTHPQIDEITREQLEFPQIIKRLQKYISTPYGETPLRDMTPHSDIPAIERMLKETEEMLGLLESGYPLPLGGLQDIQPLLEQIKPENAFLEGEDLLKIRNHLQISNEIISFFRKHSQQTPLLSLYARGIHSHTNIIKQINYAIDHKGKVVDNASPVLRSIRIRIRQLEGEQKKVLTRLLKKYAEYSQDEIVTLRDGRMVLGIQHQHVRKINGVVHGMSASGATVFVEPMEILEISNQIQSLRVEERTEEIKILQFLTGLIREIRMDLLYGIENIAMLDFVQAKGQLARELKAARPEIISEARIKIETGRHPLLLLRTGFENVVPLNLEFGNEFRTLIITGPNAGGKTVALKTIGLLILMTHYGLLIPAGADSQIPVLEKILVDIGERQSLEQDLSTFSAHVVRLRNILEQATPRSLVLIDEIGTGTDPREGAALGMAVLENLTRQNALTVATTHHGELKAFAHATGGMENASMEFDARSLQPVYRLRVGVPGSSYAFDIAERYGLPAEIIQRARDFMGAEKHLLEDLILELEKKLQEVDSQRRELNLKLTEAEALKKLYAQQVEKLKKDKSELKRKAAMEAEAVLQEAKRTIEQLVAEIRQTQARRESIKKARSLLSEKQEEVRKIIEETGSGSFTPSSFKVGEEVWIPSLNASGTVIEEMDSNGKIRIQVGNVKLNLSVNELRKSERASAFQESVSRYFKRIDEFDEGITPELDLRGMDSWEAIQETDKYLDHALEEGWQEVRIIHGKGKGILRQKINEFLSKDKRVLEKRLGRWGEGDTGVTVVRLKREEDRQDSSS